MEAITLGIEQIIIIVVIIMMVFVKSIIKLYQYVFESNYDRVKFTFIDEYQIKPIETISSKFFYDILKEYKLNYFTVRSHNPYFANYSLDDANIIIRLEDNNETKEDDGIDNELDWRLILTVELIWCPIKKIMEYYNNIEKIFNYFSNTIFKEKGLKRKQLIINLKSNDNNEKKKNTSSSFIENIDINDKTKLRKTIKDTNDIHLLFVGNYTMKMVEKYMKKGKKI